MHAVVRVRDGNRVEHGIRKPPNKNAVGTMAGSVRGKQTNAMLVQAQLSNRRLACSACRRVRGPAALWRLRRVLLRGR